MPACNFRTNPTEERRTSTKNVTKEEAIEKLQTCVQRQDPAFRKQFLDFSKEPDGKINVCDFRKVGEWVFSVFLRLSFLKEFGRFITPPRFKGWALGFLFLFHDKADPFLGIFLTI